MITTLHLEKKKLACCEMLSIVSVLVALANVVVKLRVQQMRVIDWVA
jgi:hypothetical protein